MEIQKKFYRIKSYPDTGEHIECWINLPFLIRKGEDPFHYTIKGKQHLYNSYKTKVDDRWIVRVKIVLANPSLIDIFEIKVDKNLDKIIGYCVKVYKKSLEMEIERMKKELRELEDMGK